MVEKMAEEELTEDEESTQEQELEEKPAQKKLDRKTILMIAGLAAVVFILAGAGNYIHLKMTYVPPEPVQMVVEEPVIIKKEPVLTIDLSDEEEPLMVEQITPDSTIEEESDRITEADSIRGVIDGLQASLHKGDSLRAETLEELERVKENLKVQQVQADSANYKQVKKLAKIVENMPPGEAAKMLEALSDDMIINIIMQLKQRQAAKIMAEFSSSRSARLSEVILRPIVKG